jgi:hypothetical protein
VKWTFASHARAVARHPVDPGRFETSELATKVRLAWPHGACAVSKAAHVGYWVDHAVVVEMTTLTVICADREEVTRLQLDGLALAPIRVEAGDGELAIESLTGVMRIPLAWLEQLSPGDITFTVETTYPLRDPSVRVAGRVVWLLAEDALISVRRKQLRLDHRQYGLEKGMDIAFGDELWPGAFAYLDVPGKPRQTLIERLSPYRATGRVTRVRPRDPIETTKVSLSYFARRDELAGLLDQLAANPEDDTTRGVIIDLLADAGEACADVFALLRAGAKVSVPKQRAALGPLNHFMTVKFERGLPWTATLIKKPPDDREAIATLLGDLRLGMLHALRLGKGPTELYQLLVASRALRGLRHADAPNLEVLRALRAGGHTALTHLHDVRFVFHAIAMTELADPTFDSVRHLEVPIEARHAEALLRRLLDDDHGVLARAPRHLELVEPHGRDAELARLTFPRFRELACASLTIAGVTIERSAGVATVHAAPGASPSVLEASEAGR